MNKKNKSYYFKKYLKDITSFPVPIFATLPNDLLCLFLSVFTLDNFKTRLLAHACNELDCFSCQVKKFLVSFETGKGFEDSSLVLSRLEKFSTITEKLTGMLGELHKGENTQVIKKCKCCVHENFVQFFVETSCQCSFFAGRPSEVNGKIIEISVAQLVQPESAKKELFVSSDLHNLRADGLIELGKYSVLLKTNEDFVDCLRTVVKKQDCSPELCGDSSCPKSTEIVSSKKKNAAHFIVSLNYESVEKSLFNLMQILSQLKNPLPLNLLTKNSTESFSIATIIFTGSSSYTVYTLKDSRWFELKQLSYTLLGKGLWADVAIHALKKKLFPLIIFYSKTPAINCKLSKFQLIILEALSYSIDFIKKSTGFKFLIHKINTFYNDRLEFIEKCLFCGIQRKVLEDCPKCGFFESDWNCRICGAFNFMKSKVCCYCEFVRIHVEQDFKCSICRRESFGSIDCIYCPSFMCKKCRNSKSTFTSIFCVSCNRLVHGDSRCARSHNVWCFVCFQNTNQFQNYGFD